MPVPTVLVVDDTPQIRRVVRLERVADGARVLEAASGREGADLAAAERPDLIVLDLGLPGGPGIDVGRDLRAWSTVPAVVLSARHAEKAALLDVGADDYATEPFGPVEFRARVRAQLRRARIAGGQSADARVEADGLVVDLARRAVTRDGVAVHLTPTERELHRALTADAGRTMTHRQLFAEVWVRGHGDAQQ